MTLTELDALRQAWEQTNKMLRFGQYVVVYAPRSEFPLPVPAIFYQPDPDKAYALIVEFTSAQ